MADPLRDRIALYLDTCDMEDMAVEGWSDASADAVLAIVRAHATSDAAVEEAIKVLNERAIWLRRRDMRAAITAALGGKP